MSYSFFLSYAREDSRASTHLQEFYHNLATEVKKRSPALAEPFLEVEEIKTGEDWSERMKRALMTAKVLLCVVSPTYLTRDFCGKELAVFNERDLHYRKMLGDDQLSRPPIILPVLWIPVKEPLPIALLKYQQTDADLPSEYCIEGLEYLMRLNSKHDTYQEFLVRFADKVVDALTRSMLPDLVELRHFDQIENPFPRRAVPAPAGLPAAAAPRGPSSARFIFIAPLQKEMLGIKNSLSAYDDQGGWYWRPFWPHQDTTIGEVAQEITSQVRMRYNELQLPQDLGQQIREAKRDNSILIVVLDPWAVRLEWYRLSLMPFDELSSLHATAVIVWNCHDLETAKERAVLEDTLRVTLPSKFSLKPALQIRDDISSSDELRQRLRDTLVDIQMRLLEIGEAKRRIGGAFVPKPILPVATVVTDG
jgi:FxsC-like protein